MELNSIINRLSSVPGVKALALGGSQSRGEADSSSDYDFGLYYNEAELGIAELNQILRELDDNHRPDLLNPPGKWGPWINGGAWLTVDGTPVDLLLREIGRVERVIKECLVGQITIDYQCGHPFGFVNIIYAAETHYCRPLWQSEDKPLDRLKSLLYSDGPYSLRMKGAVVSKFLWEASFSLACGQKAALRGDFHYAAGSVFRGVSAWVEVLYALNERYLMNEKGSLPSLEHLPCKPAQFETRVRNAYRLILDQRSKEAYQLLDGIQNEMDSLIKEKAL